MIVVPYESYCGWPQSREVGGHQRFSYNFLLLPDTDLEMVTLQMRLIRQDTTAGDINVDNQ